MINNIFNDDTILARWLSNELSAEELDALKKHPDFSKYEEIINAVENMAVPSFNREQAMKQILHKKEAIKKTQSRRRYIKYVMATAASLVLAIGAFYFLGLSNSTKTGVGEKISLNLPDSSVVHLNAVTQIKFSKKRWEEERVIELKGEAYFDVSPGKEFLVRTAQGKVSVLGTKFNILSRDESFEVSCAEGKVKVEVPGANSKIITKGEFVMLSEEKLIKKYPESNHSSSWINGETMFRGTSIVQVLNELMRQYDVKVDFAGNKEKRYSGPMPHNNLEQALQIICSSMGLKYTFTGQSKIKIDDL